MSPIPSHPCHVLGCQRSSPLRHVMCSSCWSRVPAHMKAKIWLSKHSSEEWLLAARNAIRSVA